MKKLQLEKYCDNCPYFEVEVFHKDEKVKMLCGPSVVCPGEEYHPVHFPSEDIITCKNIEKCKNIEQAIRKQIRSEKESEK